MVARIVYIILSSMNWWTREEEQERVPLIDELCDPDDTIDGEFVPGQFEQSDVALTKRLQTDGAGAHQVRRLHTDVGQDRILGQ